MINPSTAVDELTNCQQDAVVPRGPLGYLCRMTFFIRNFNPFKTVSLKNLQYRTDFSRFINFILIEYSVTKKNFKEVDVI